VTAEDCLRVSGDPTEFQRMIGQLDPADESNNGKPASPRGERPGTATKR
jgi:hypothetical protein